MRLYKVFIQSHISGFRTRQDAVNFWRVQKSASVAAKQDEAGTRRLFLGETQICLIEHLPWWVLDQVVPLGIQPPTTICREIMASAMTISLKYGAVEETLPD